MGGIEVVVATGTLARKTRPTITDPSTYGAENRSASIAACYRSGMNKYELILHLQELDFREIDQLFAKLFGLANGIHEEIYSQHPIYLPYT